MKHLHRTIYQISSTPMAQVRANIAADVARLPKDCWYDYDRQAWVVDGRYDYCGHTAKNAGCYACNHAGEIAPIAHRRQQ